MDNNLRAYFYFTKNERIGILVVCFLSFCLLFVPKFFQQSGFLAKPTTSNELQDADNRALEHIHAKSSNTRSAEREVTEHEYKYSGKLDVNTASFKQLKSIGISSKTAAIIIKYRDKGGQFRNLDSFKKIYGITANELNSIRKKVLFPEQEASATCNAGLKPFDFDPNSVSKEELAAMGLPLRIIQTISNFRDKGGRFYEKNDLAKIYGMKPEWIESLLPFVSISANESPRTTFESAFAEERQSNVKPKNYRTEVHKSEVFNINTATKEDLMKIKGVGPFYAEKIIKFRDALGGFVTVAQLAETRGLPDTLVKSIAPQLTVNGDVNKLKINQLNKSDLARHPYISHPQALILSNYIQQHGKMQSLEDVRKSRAFEPAELNKLVPYLDFSE